MSLVVLLTIVRATAALNRSAAFAGFASDARPLPLTYRHGALTYTHARHARGGEA